MAVFLKIPWLFVLAFSQFGVGQVQPVALHEWSYPTQERSQKVTDEFGFVTNVGTEPTENITIWIFEEGTFRPTAKITNEEKFSIVTDYLGTPAEMYDKFGIKVWSCELDIYGKVRKFEGNKYAPESTSCPFRYQGQYEDAETGLYYNRFRYYSPEMGGYLSQDPIGLAGGNPTLYGYVFDTNIWIDIWGLLPFYRGSRGSDAVSFTARLSEYKVSSENMVLDTHGVSVFDNADSVIQKGFTPNEIMDVPESLKVIQRGADIHHYEIVPKEKGKLTPVQFNAELNKIKCK